MRSAAPTASARPGGSGGGNRTEGGVGGHPEPRAGSHPDDTAPPWREQRLGLYIHVPFCRTRCTFCNFNRYAGLDDLVVPHAEALAMEIADWGRVLPSRTTATVCFGGGTPSLLPLPLLERILAAVREAFPPERDCEITLEAHPATLDPRYLYGLRQVGINRLSVGVESFHDHELAPLHRSHTAAQAEQAYRWAREAGFQRINLDLMFGLPGQPLESWQDTVERALALGVEHLSLYGLRVKDGTPLAAEVARGQRPAPRPEVQAAMYAWSDQRLGSLGYQHYELSHWCLPGQQARHSLRYWEIRPFLGVGAGALSFVADESGTFCFANERSPRGYVDRVRQNRVTAGPLREAPGSMRQLERMDELTPEAVGTGAAVLGLRLVPGVAEEPFRRWFGVDAATASRPFLDGVEGLDRVEQRDGRLRLTPRGQLWAYQTFPRFMPEWAAGRRAF